MTKMTPPRRLHSRRAPVVYAHRGMHVDETDENRVASFRAAARYLDGFECDVRMSSDQCPFILHDATLRRTHRRAPHLRTQPASWLRAQGVPSLARVLHDHRHGTHTIVLDLKDDAYRAMCAARDLARRAHIPASRIIYLIWDNAQRVPARPHGAVFRAYGYRFRLPPPSARTAWSGVACKFNGSAVNRACIDRALAAGLHVNLYAPHPRDRATLVRDYGHRARCTLTMDVAPCGTRGRGCHVRSRRRAVRGAC